MASTQSRRPNSNTASALSLVARSHFGRGEIVQDGIGLELKLVK